MHNPKPRTLRPEPQTPRKTLQQKGFKCPGNLEGDRTPAQASMDMIAWSRAFEKTAPWFKGFSFALRGVGFASAGSTCTVKLCPRDANADGTPKLRGPGTNEAGLFRGSTS